MHDPFGLKPVRARFVPILLEFYANPGPIRAPRARGVLVLCLEKLWEVSVMKVAIERLAIEIIAAALLVACLAVSSAAFAAGKMGRSGDGVSCGFSVPANASPAARCAAIKRQCGGKFYANYCGDKMLSAM
jgi:hypothetical protein